MSPPTPLASFIIPARGGSKGLPGKNLLPVHGVPLVVRAVRAALSCQDLGPVFVSTDDAAIAAAAARAGATVIDRPAELASDQASSESALVHVLDQAAASGAPDPEICVLVQCTSPFIDPDDIRGTVELVRSGQADTAFTASPSHAFLWHDRDTGAVAVNHDPATRQRRQDLEVTFRETGAVYAMRTDGLRRHGSRFFGTSRLYPVPPERSVEVDDAFDYTVAQALAGAIPSTGSRPTFDRPVGAAVFDFDGVMTDNTAWVTDEGHEMVQVSREDGFGIEQLRRAGLPLLVLSKETNPVVARRAAKLDIECIAGCDDKWTALTGWLAERGVPADQTVYVGNDLNDLECLIGVGIAVVVAGAHPSVLEVADLVLTRPGGRGAVRELADLILAARPPVG